LHASAAVAALILAYLGLAFGVYIKTRFWLPLVIPITGACFMVYVCLLAWRVVFEQAERRRTRAVLSTIVSPKIANVLLQSEQLTLEGARREVTVLFADVRGFTEFTDTSQERVAELVRQNQLTGAAAEACFDQQARETLTTINEYLGIVADQVLLHDGVWDKFIGDCVMAFWGHPNPDRRHATACVRAAIAAQRAIDELNRQRKAENEKREAENPARAAAGLPPNQPQPILFLGTGINTGLVTVGLMGSQVKGVARQGNYTVFGREVNLASRLEGASGRGRIFISQSTFEHLQRDDPALAATCLLLDKPIALKGFRNPVPAYEVPWGPTQTPPPASTDTTAFTPISQHVKA
jgi:adenylate cyclase